MRSLVKMLLLATAVLFSGCDDERETGESSSEAYLPVVGPQGTDNGVVLACTGPLVGTPAVLCVDTANATAGAGTATNPYKTIASAITAGKAGDTIQIAQGTYFENPVIGAFNSGNSKRMNFHGGFQTGSSFGTRNAATYRTIIDGGLTNPGLRLFINAGVNNMTVDGLSITRGKGIGTNWQNGYGNGGGIYVQWFGTGTLTISHVDLYANQSNTIAANSQMGGGIWVTTQSTGPVRLEDSNIYNNKAGKGAGVGWSGRGTILRNRIEDNLGQGDHGGGMYLVMNSGVVDLNLVKNNATGVLAGYGWGGGALVLGTASLKGNVWTENFAPLIGSGLFIDEGAVVSVTNDLFFKNDCTNDARSGAAIYVDGAGSSGPGSTATLTNVTVADHICPNMGTTGAAVFLERQSSVTIKNSVFWDNTKDTKGSAGTTVSATYSTITGVTGTGNLTSNPQFVNSSVNDYHLKSTAGHFTTGGWVTDATTSLAIDAGDPASSYANEPAPNGSRVNMGFEGDTAEASKSATLDYEDCPGQPYSVALNSSQNITGNAGTSTDDQTACGTTSGDRVYKLNLAATGGILSLNVTGATFAVRTTCESSSGEVCGTSTQFEATASTYYVVVEGAGSFSLTVDYDASVCGDGFLASNEECEAPTEYCVEPGQPNECTSTAPDPVADSCPGKSYSVPTGITNLNSESEEFTTVNYTDDYIASCATEPDGRDYVLNLTPEATGTLTVRVGFTDAYCDDNADDEFCWDVVLSARATCSDDESEVACVNDNFAGEEMVLSVTEDVPLTVMIDGFNAGWYSYGPFDVQLELN